MCYRWEWEKGKFFWGVFEKFYCSRVFRVYFGIFLENILKYLRVVEFLKYFLNIKKNYFLEYLLEYFLKIFIVFEKLVFEKLVDPNRAAFLKLTFYSISKIISICISTGKVRKSSWKLYFPSPGYSGKLVNVHIHYCRK